MQTLWGMGTRPVTSMSLQPIFTPSWNFLNTFPPLQLCFLLTYHPVMLAHIYILIRYTPYWVAYDHCAYVSSAPHKLHDDYAPRPPHQQSHHPKYCVWVCACVWTYKLDLGDSVEKCMTAQRQASLILRCFTPKPWNRGLGYPHQSSI